MTAGDAVPSWLLWLLVAFVTVPAGIGWLALAGPVRKARRMQRCEAESPVEPTAKDLPTSSGASGRPDRPGAGAADPGRRLEEARLVLLVAESLLNDAASRSLPDILGLSLDRGRAKQSSFGAGVRQLRQAEDLAYRAFAQLGLPSAREPLELDTDPLVLGMDTAWVTDGVFAGLAVHRRIKEARRRTRALLARIEASR